MKRSRPVSKFKFYTPAALYDYAEGVRLAMTGNPLFASPPVSLADQQLVNETFIQAILAWGVKGNHGAHRKHVEMLDARKAVEESLRSLENFVDGKAAGDKGVILAAGMIPKGDGGPFGVLYAPQNLRGPRTKRSVPGQYGLRWDKVRGAKSYVLFMSSLSSPESKAYVTVVTKTRAIIERPELPPGTVHYFWVAAVGSSGVGVLSDVCAARNW